MRKLLFLSFIFSSFLSVGQRAETIVRAGDEFFSNAQYIKAIGFYKAALEERPEYLTAQYKLAESYRLTQDYESAEFYYEALAQLNDTRFPLSGFYYGLMLKLKGKYSEALQLFRTFDKLLKDNNLHEDDQYRYFYKQSKIEIDGCQLALNQVTIMHPDHQFIALNEPVNSPFNDYAAFSIGTDSLLCLTSARKSGKGNLLDHQFGESFADLFRFVGNNGDWKPYEENDRFETVINTKWGDGSGSFNKDQTKFYYTNCEESVGEVCHIYVASLEDGKWTEPVPLNQNINLDGFNSKHPNLTPLGDTLFFVSDREGGIGGLDLWMSLNAGGESWGPPSNIGNQINTPFNEISPYYDENDNVLFFASDGHRGFGGYDIYIARGRSFTSADIYNAGIPFNSNKDDIFFTLGNRKGLVTSNREGGIGKFDIYGFNIKSKEDLVAEVAKKETLAGRNSLFTGDYDFDNRETEIINQIISRTLSAQFSDVNVVLTEKQLEVYNSLSLDDKERIEKIVNARLRKMNSNMLRSVRSEDDYYYQRLSTDKRRKVDRMVTSHIEQNGLGLSVSMSEEGTSFYESEQDYDREKLDILILERLSNANKFKPAPTTLNEQSPQNQRTIAGIAVKYLEQKKGLNSIALTATERVLFRDAEGVERAKINTAIREKLLALSNEAPYQIEAKDRVFYEELNEEYKSNVKAIANSFMTADVDHFDEVVNSKHLKMYEYFNVNDDRTLNKLLLKQIANLASADIYKIESTFSREELIGAKTDDPDEVLATLLALKPDLSEADKQTLERFVHTTYNSYLSLPKQVYPVSSKPIQVVEGHTPFNFSDSEGDSESLVLELSPDVIQEYQSLTPQRKSLIDKLVAVAYINEAYSSAELFAMDKQAEKTLNLEERTHIKILSDHFLGNKINESILVSRAFTYYNNLAPRRKALINRLVLSQSMREENGKYLLNKEESTLNARLTEEDRNLVKSLSTFRFNNERVLTENIAVEAMDVDDAPVDAMAMVDIVEPASTERESSRVEPIATEGSEESVEKREVISYVSLTPAKRKILDKLVALSYINEVYTDSDLADQDEKAYLSFPNTEKAHINVLANSIYNSSEVTSTNLLAARNYYEGLPSIRKAQLNRLVLSKTFDRNGEKFELKETDRNNQKSLTEDELELVGQLESDRSTNQAIITTDMTEATAIESTPVAKIEKVKAQPVEIISENEVIPPSKETNVARKVEKNTNEVLLQLPNYTKNPSNMITIEGQLQDPVSGLGLAAKQITLQDQGGDQTEIASYTDDEGNFSFQVPGKEYQVSLNKNDSESGRFYLKNTIVKEAEGRSTSISKASNARGYFNTDSYALRKEAKVVLGEIVTLYKNGNFKVEIESHTDNVGNEQYNKNLSKRRGYAAFDYLVSKGINKSDVSVIWHGYEKPISHNNNAYGRQLNRRIDITLSKEVLHDFGEIYIVRPGVTLYSISKSFGISIDEIKQWNGLISSKITAFQPLRILNKKEVSPNLNLLVPENIITHKSFIYTVANGGENVQSISEKFNVPEELIVELNNLDLQKVPAGTKLRIYPGSY